MLGLYDKGYLKEIVTERLTAILVYTLFFTLVCYWRSEILQSGLCLKALVKVILCTVGFYPFLLGNAHDTRMVPVGLSQVGVFLCSGVWGLQAWYAPDLYTLRALYRNEVYKGKILP
ncbi:hypothetical protein L873DRAFT_297543 [Choiromyces venosus 120613-1]|uniref:Uncharacterized protein n=1 Tax=Choiromyces venosus 120613-1 TaxID=1336337 RepID=A0A3N4JCP3_9PEZI|nr:hypothetical protein L873DRAFT_297543 [Choiromyces venosus 120613-1]